MQEITISKLQEYNQTLIKLRDFRKQIYFSSLSIENEYSRGQYNAFQEAISILNDVFANELQEEL